MLLAWLAYAIQHEFLTNNHSQPLAALSFQDFLVNKGQPGSGDSRPVINFIWHGAPLRSKA